MKMSDQNQTTSVSSFLSYPKFLNNLWQKSNSDTETILTSPTSILDTKNSHQIPKSEADAIGLALIDALSSDENNSPKSINRMVLFQSKLTEINPSSLLPAEFGMKTRSSQISSPVSETPAKDFNRQLSLKEMEVCEDYTCVISHGPNRKTTHIFDDCVVGCSCEEDDDKVCDQMKNESSFEYKDCSLGEEDNNIYPKRSRKYSLCGCKEMLYQGMENSGLDETL